MNRETLQQTDGPVSITLVEHTPVDMAGVLAQETRLLETLVSEVLRQRRGIAENDVALVDETVQGTQRILLTLGEARQKRRTVIRMLVGETLAESQELERILVGRMTPDSRAAWTELKAAAEVLSRELETNRKLLEEAIQLGEDFVRTLYGVTSANSGAYTARAQPSSDGGGGMLVNRRV